MDKLDELFDGMPEPDAGLDFVIDESKRLIAVPEEGVVLGVEGDKDVNRIRLRINRYYRGSDLADFAIRVNYENAEGDRNYFTVTEKTVTEQTITFIWVVAADAVAYKGAVHFAVSFYRVNDNGEILQKYNTTLGTVQNLVGLEVDAAQNDPVVVDFMTHLKNDITEHANPPADEKGCREHGDRQCFAAGDGSCRKTDGQSHGDGHWRRWYGRCELNADRAGRCTVSAWQAGT